MPAVAPPTGSLWNAVAPMAPWPQPDETVLAALADGWRAAGTQFTDLGRFSLTDAPAAWGGAAGAAFVERVRATLGDASGSGSTMTGMAAAAERFAEEVMQLKLAIREYVALNEAAFVGLTLLPNGVGERISTEFAVETANTINQLTADTAGRISGQGAPIGVPPLPPPDATPRENADWWATLTESQKLQLAREHPEEIGSRDGIPAGYRDIANRIVLDRERDGVAAELADLRAQRDAVSDTAPDADLQRVLLDARIDETVKKQDGLTDIAKRLNETAGNQDHERYYLLDVDGTRDGQAVVAIGNPDTADNVATLVPGTMTEVGSLGGILNWANNTQGAAVAAAPDETTSVVTWLGYDSPDEIPDAALPYYADEGKDELADFQQGLRESRGDGERSHNTIIGHSYGGTIAGFAARDHGLDVDDFVSVASPGVGAFNAGQLNVPEGHVWATESHDDIIGDIAAHGPDPTSGAFGARTFDADADQSFRLPWLDTNAKHNEYFREGVPNPALDGIGKIVAGEEPGTP